MKRIIGFAVFCTIGLTAPAEASLRSEYTAKFTELVDRHGVHEAGCNLLTDTKRWNRCDGKATKTDLHESTATLERMLYVPEPEPVAAPQPSASSGVSTYSEPAPTASSASTGSSWDSTAQCESSGNWSANTGNGYYGGLQFDSQTWDAYGNPAYGEASEAPASEQIAAAERVPYDAWPSC